MYLIGQAAFHRIHFIAFIDNYEALLHYSQEMQQDSYNEKPIRDSMELIHKLDHR